MTSFVSQTQEIIEVLPKKYELNILIVYHNKAKGTKLETRLILKDANDKIDNKSTVKFFNAIISAKSSK